MLFSNPSMNDEINQDGTTWATQVAQMKQLSQRAAKLSERGAHYFVGWLIGAGMHKPAMMAEFEKVMTRLENDPELSHCWRESSSLETTAAAATASESAVVLAESSPAMERAVATEVQAVSTESLETTLEKSNAADEETSAAISQEQECESSSLVKFETTIHPETEERQGFFAKIFRRQRVAA